MKKTISILIIICLIITLISCVKKTDFQIFDDDETTDFHGGDFVIAVSNDLGHCLPKKGSTASADRILERYAATEKLFNFTYSYKLNINPGVAFLQAALSGGSQYDLLYTGDGYAYGAYLVNSLTPVENFVTDPESDKWQIASSRIGLYDGKQYCIFPNYWESSPSILGFININLTLFDEYNIEDPHIYIEEGTWNWTNFRSVIAKTVINDGDKKWEGFIVNAMGTGSTCITPFMIANGAHYITDTNGRSTCEIDSQEAIEALEFVCSLINEGIMKEVGADYEGLTLMYNYGSRGYSDNSEYQICGIRYPYGPSGNKDIVSTIIKEEVVWAFPIFSAYSEEEVGAVVEYMFEPLSIDYPNGWKDIIEDKYFYNHEDFEYYLKGVNDAEYIDYVTLNDSFWVLDDAIMASLRGIQTPGPALESVIDAIQEEINEKYNK